MEWNNMHNILMQGRLSISDEVYNQILLHIIEGKWKVGEKIPSEKELCQLFGVSRVTVRTALERLSARGIIVTRQGKGSFVQSAGAVTRGDDPNLEFDRREDVLQFASFRQCTETKAVELFLQRATPADFQELQEMVRRIGSAKDPQEMLEADLAFHGKIVRSCGNQYLLQCWEMFQGAYAWNFRNSYQKNHYTPAGLQQHHQEVLDALCARDVRAAMSTILRGFIR